MGSLPNHGTNCKRLQAGTPVHCSCLTICILTGLTNATASLQRSLYGAPPNAPVSYLKGLRAKECPKPSTSSSGSRDCFTYHLVLQRPMTLPDLSGCLIRWKLHLVEYWFVLKYGKFLQNSIAVMSSRPPSNSFTEAEVDSSLPCFAMDVTHTVFGTDFWHDGYVEICGGKPELELMDERDNCVDYTTITSGNRVVYCNPLPMIPLQEMLLEQSTAHFRQLAIKHVYLGEPSPYVDDPIPWMLNKQD